MKKVSLLLLFVAGVFSASCSLNGTKIASYTLNGKEKTVTLGEYTKLVPAYLNRNPQWIADTTRQKEMVYQGLIFPQLISVEMMKQGMTNDSAYIAKYKNLDNQLAWGILNRMGRNSMTNIAGQKFTMARVSHILIKVDQFTNLKGKRVKIADGIYQRMLAAAKLKADNILATLKKSKNLDKDFQKAAKDNSDDPGSKAKGGDLDYFFPGRMVKEFDTAVFSAKKKGLLEEPVKTDYGFHIIYVTDPARKRSVNEIKKIMGPKKSQYMGRYLQSKYLEDMMKKETEVLYTLDQTNKSVIVDKKVYKDVNKIPDNAGFLKIKGKVYTWKMSKNVIEAFVPTFVTNKTFDTFSRNMGILKNFMYFVEVAKAKGLDKSPAYKKKIEKQKEMALKEAARDFYNQQLIKEATKNLTDDTVKKYYENMKTRFTKTKKLKNGKTKQVQMSFNDAKPQIRKELLRNLEIEANDKMNAKLKKQYNVKIDEAGMKVYADKLNRDYQRYLAKQKRHKKKKPMTQNRQPNMPQLRLKPTPKTK